jgi:hypothetical protein
MSKLAVKHLRIVIGVTVSLGSQGHAQAGHTDRMSEALDRIQIRLDPTCAMAVHGCTVDYTFR